VAEPSNPDAPVPLDPKMGAGGGGGGLEKRIVGGGVSESDTAPEYRSGTSITGVEGTGELRAVRREGRGPSRC
jgi:hypothetical protein